MLHDRVPWCLERVKEAFRQPAAGRGLAEFVLV